MAQHRLSIGTVTEPDEADPARLLERTGILFAALTPERENVFPDDVSPVDLFRLLFDAYFDTQYGRATPPDKRWAGGAGGCISPRSRWRCPVRRQASAGAGKG